MHPFIGASDSFHLVPSLVRPMLHIRDSITVQTCTLVAQQSRRLPYASLQQPNVMPSPDAIANFAITMSHAILPAPQFYTTIACQLPKPVGAEQVSQRPRAVHPWVVAETGMEEHTVVEEDRQTSRPQVENQGVFRSTAG